jgi:hypothetical protein
MHLIEFVLRDFINIEKYSHEKTIVAIDDIFPNHELQASRNRRTAAWTGDAWKITECLRVWRPGLKLTLLDTSPAGMLVIAGLDCEDKTLALNYNSILRHFLDMPFEGTTASGILAREGSTHPGGSDYWVWLSSFLHNPDLLRDQD